MVAWFVGSAAASASTRGARSAGSPDFAATSNSRAAAEQRGKPNVPALPATRWAVRARADRSPAANAAVSDAASRSSSARYSSRRSSRSGSKSGGAAAGSRPRGAAGSDRSRSVSSRGEGGEQGVQVERLGHVLGAAGGPAPLPVAGQRLGGDGQHRAGVAAAAQLPGGLQAAQHRHLHVHQHRVERRPAVGSAAGARVGREDRVDGGPPVRHAGHLGPGPAEGAVEQLAVRLPVVGHQDPAAGQFRQAGGPARAAAPAGAGRRRAGRRASVRAG